MRAFFSIFGWILIAASILTPLIMIGLQVTDSYPDAGDWLYDLFVEGILPGAASFVLGFLPGKYLIGIGKGSRNENWLNKTALIILIIEIIIILIGFLSGVVNELSNPYGASDFQMGLAIMFIFIAPWPYAISIILLVIDYFKQRE